MRCQQANAAPRPPERTRHCGWQKEREQRSTPEHREHNTSGPPGQVGQLAATKHCHVEAGQKANGQPAGKADTLIDRGGDNSTEMAAGVGRLNPRRKAPAGRWIGRVETGKRDDDKGNHRHQGDGGQLDAPVSCSGLFGDIGVEDVVAGGKPLGHAAGKAAIGTGHGGVPTGGAGGRARTGLATVAQTTLPVAEKPAAFSGITAVHLPATAHWLCGSRGICRLEC